MKSYFKIIMGILMLSSNLFAQVKPDENRFTKTILVDKLDEPMEMSLLKDGRVLFVERKGAFRQFNPETGELKTIAMIPVNTKYTNKKGQSREAEEGLMGLTHDPNFEQNHWIYMYYADPKENKHVLARWEFKEEKLIEESKKIVLEVGTQREECCHTGGGMTWDKAGNLYLTTGNNTSNGGSDGYSNIDERKDWENYDDQRGASNTNDLRGKILRIKPQTDGTYTIPKGNLFPEGTAKTRPEIYTMGHRNPWRPSIDSKTGFLYWGEVGPDASVDGAQGPRGYDEFNQAKGPANFGWPYFIGDNKPYTDWDFETKTAKSSKFDPAKPINDSPNNTGLTELPPATKAFIWYPYGLSEEFPLVGASGRSATGGPVFRKADFPIGKRTFPDYYEGKWLAVEFMRGWIMAITMDEKGDYKSMERFMPNTNFTNAIDIDFAPDGDLYILEYGTAWFRGNENAQITRVQYNAGNRPPMVVASADKTSGSVPFKVNLSSTGTIDYDGDNLTYSWEVKGKSGTRKFKTANAVVPFDKAGTYDVTLTVKDNKGEENSQSLEIKAGNEPPAVSFDIQKGNKTFYFPNQPIEYEVKVDDKEDGNLTNGKIKPEQVAVSIDYIPIGYDKIEASQNHRGIDAVAFASIGERIINKNDCKSCHIIDNKSVGPSYKDIANKYKGDNKAMDYLSKKVINGGGGVWGSEHSMAAHPMVTVPEANAMVEYILGINDKKEFKSLPIKGTYETKIPDGQKSNGTFMIRAAYKDKGTKSMKSLATEDVRILRSTTLNPEFAEKSKNTQLITSLGRAYNILGDGAYFAFEKIDLTGISAIELNAQAQTRVGATGGIIEVRLDSPTGTLLGKSENVEPREVRFGPPQPNQPRPATPPKPKITIPSNSGQHDLYFVFKSDKVKPNQIMMSVSSVEFLK
jgi:cytochrome c